MSTLNEEITRLEAAKAAIDEILIAKGVAIPANATFSEYASLINSIKTGTSSAEVTATRADVLAGTYTITSDSNGEVVEGTIPIKGGQIYYAEKTNQLISGGQYLSDGLTIHRLESTNFSAGNIKNGVTISVNNGESNVFSVKGTFGSDATLASSANLLTGDIAYGKDGVKITGTMPNNGAVSQTITPSESVQSYTIAKGYHNGNGKVTVNASEKVYRRIGISGFAYNTLLYVDENGNLTCPSSDATEIYALEGIVSFDSNSGKDSLARVIQLDFEYACFPSGTYDEYSFYGTNGEHYHYPRVFRFLSDDGELFIDSMMN